MESIFVGSLLTVTEVAVDTMVFTVTVAVMEPVPGNFSVMHLICVAETEIT
jgi:hypothetical protein